MFYVPTFAMLKSAFSTMVLHDIHQKQFLRDGYCTVMLRTSHVCDLRICRECKAEHTCLEGNGEMLRVLILSRANLASLGQIFVQNSQYI